MSATEIHDCRPANFESLSFAEKNRYATPDDVEEQIATFSGHIAVACQLEGFEDISVLTTNTEVQEMLQKFLENNDHAKSVLKGTFKEITKYRGKVDELYERGGEEWGNFCNDIVLLSVAQCVLLNKPIPVLSTIPKDACPHTLKFKGKPENMPRMSSLPEN